MESSSTDYSTTQKFAEGQNPLIKKIHRLTYIIPKLAPRACFLKKIPRIYKSLTLISETNTRKNIYFCSRSKVIQERIRQQNSRYWYVIHPFSVFAKYRQIVMYFIWSLATLNDMYTVAFRDRHMNQGQDIIVIYWRKITYCLNSCCIIDIFLRFFTAYVDERRKIVILNQRKIIMRYIFTWFVIDTIPVAFIYTYEAYKFYIKLVYLSKYVRIARIYTLMNYFKWITEYLNFTITTYTVLCIVQILLYVNHFNACTYVYIPEFFNELYPEIANKSWITKLEQNYIKANKNLTCWYLYIHSFKECLLKIEMFGRSSSIPPENLNEKVLSLLFIFSGWLAQLGLFVALYYIFEDLYRPSLSYTEHANLIGNFCRKKKLPKYLQRKIFAYYRYRYENYVFENSFEVTTKLYLEILIDIWDSGMETSNLFKELSATSVLQPYLKPDLIMVGNTVYEIGEQADDIYFICNGSVAVYDEYDAELGHLWNGQLFGVGSLDDLLSNRTERVVAIEWCQVFRMKRIFALQLSSKLPDFKKILSKYSKTITKDSIEEFQTIN